MYLKGWWSVAVWFLLPAWLIKTFNLYVNATWGLISSAHLHLEKNNKLKFNVAIMRVYGDHGEEGDRGAAGLMRGLSEGSGPTWINPLQEWPDARVQPRLSELTAACMSPHHGLLVNIRAFHCYQVQNTYWLRYHQLLVNRFVHIPVANIPFAFRKDRERSHFW